ncbi:MAG: glycoside hydrolase family 9 protein [Endomicrobiia bacterium]
MKHTKNKKLYLKKFLIYLLFQFFIFVKFLFSPPIPGAPLIRLNQAGYSTDDNYKTAVVSGLSGTFSVHRYNTDEMVFSGNLSALGTDSVTSEILYLADFSAVNTPGVYYLKVGSEVSPKFEIRDDLYNKVLYYTLRVYGANRCGPYHSWIHKPCHTKDGMIRGSGKEGSLAGGWHDCGDHVKFGHTVFYAACMLLFAYNNWPNRFGDVYGMEYNGTYYNPNPDGIPDVLNEVKVVTDYLLNLYNASVEDGLISQNRLYYQVGDGDDDHTWWHKPENQDNFPQSRGGQPREAWSDIGADLAGRFSACLAMMATAYYKFDIEYANKCLDAAKVVYQIAKNVYGQTGKNTGGKGYYSPDNRADDDMALAALELYKATGDSFYLRETQYWMYKEQKWQFCSYYVLSFPNVFALVLYDYYPYASPVDNAPGEIDTKVVTKDECIEWLERDVLQSAPAADIYGRKWDYGWGTCRYMMGVAATAVMAYDLSLKKGTPNSQMLKIAKDQMNWVFGRNQFGMSFIVGNKQDGWLTRYPQHPHHRAANPDGENVPELPTYQATELTGATIGGPKSHTDFSDRWNDYVATETGVDYWAGTLVTVAYFAKPVSTITDTKPTLSFVNLQNGTTVQGNVTVQIQASDDRGVSKIELYISNNKVYEAINSNSLVYLWNTTLYSNGVYQIKATAYDTINQSSEKTISVYVLNGFTTPPDGGGSGGGGGQPQDTPPLVIFQNLTNGTTVSGSIEINVYVSDDKGITNVLFYINNNLIATYSGSFNYIFYSTGYPNGTHYLKVVAIDTLQQSTTQQLSIYINNVPNDLPPTVTILTPQNNQIISGTFQITASATDDHLIKKIELYINNQLVYTTNSGYINYDWNTTIYLNDTYFIKVVAYDNNNQTGYKQIQVRVYNDTSQNNNQQENSDIINKNHYLLNYNQPVDFSKITNDILKVEIFDGKGKVIKAIESPPFLLSLDDKLKIGFYLYKITTKNNQKFFGTIKVIK